MGVGTYRLLALDMDGTALDEEGRISASTREWIGKAAEAGVTVIFSTGRGAHNVVPFMQQLGLDTPMVTINGGVIWRRPGELLEQHPMDAGQVLTMRTMAVEADAWYWGYESGGVRNRDNWPEDAAQRQWLKFGFSSDDLDRLESIRRVLESWGTLEITNSSPNNLELNPKGIHKAYGLERVCRLLGFGMEQVVAIGDSLNDIAAIRAAGLGIAMGNAQEAVKRAADAVTGANGEDGVAKAIRKHIFGLD